MALFGSKKNTSQNPSEKASKAPLKAAAKPVAKKADKTAQNTAQKGAKVVAVSASASASPSGTPVSGAAYSNRDLSSILVRPRVTEKAAAGIENNVYSFEVSPRATKHTVAAALRELYNVTPVKVRILAMQPKQVFVRGNWGTRGGGKKAYVYLKKGETIEIV